MDLVSRVQAIILKPKEEWVKIKAESSTISELFTSYAVLLAAIPAIAQFIGIGLIGRRIPFLGWYKPGIGSAFAQGIYHYVLSLVAVYVFALVINALAPTFSSTPNMVNALKLSVYSMTPMWVAGILYIIPSLGWLAGIAGLYGLYVLYLGFNTPLMDTPKEKVPGYLLISIVVVVVLYIIIFAIAGAIFVVGKVGLP